ncbi:glycosyltransferase involved in cell wall biosynthesis [Dyadobacter sp. BE34]|uniref:Glycosyltransferase involved in cell wall biosynthesis n=1 Tax=Dyadobacter fermentans TaxID=94254 RepID=A0ABU1QYY3_9BACT|nr:MULTISPECIES: glycosyltransferase family 2 protein [Dyadobacter]MDR6806222.1 glycosyltransferase involved in cell wall biosynthesis [Dyadobacter fermentans]MDR7043963.1 glycosyltransferase involved in cell wall biosynthesis [Dyadobacter sp. BE242]MDR7198274.1 glycosyltransferase involved in cell wall biosynthesis [Dyadobacter sp. BE34]MDR7216237.1 glycosyltransferase involved in cell wall biosynthesis [Dyadobacter sp. BE31]MDR7264237.1 glycosyltransferase involved in cell wall biosynthesis 
MKVSILTVVYNGAATIRHSIESVLGQDYPDIEYIIVDGNSKDGTQDIVRSYGDKIARFLSEPDAGIYDAMNKGIQLATGDVIGILNADDFYAYPSVVSDVAEVLASSNADASYGDLEYIDANDATLVRRKWVSGAYKVGAFLNGWMPPHPTFFVRKEVYNTHGHFRLDLGSAADYELMLRFVHRENIRLAYLPKVLVKMRAGGVSNSTLKNRIAANQNDRLAWKINNLKPRFYTLWLKPLRKIIQFI